jgi:hypothetical protein
MTKGLNGLKGKKKSWKTRIERDIIQHRDIKESGLQGGKGIGDNLPLLSFIIGLPLFLIGLYAIISIIFGFGFPLNLATSILVIIVTTIGLIMCIGGYFIYKRD